MQIAISRNQQAVWPPKCIVCGVPCSTTVDAKCSIVKKVGHTIVAITWTTVTYTIRVPMCPKHIASTSFARLFSQRNLLNLGLATIGAIALGMGVVIPVLMHFYGGQPITQHIPFVVISSIIALSTIGTFVGARSLAPFRLLDITDHLVLFDIKNEVYAREFAAVNPQVI